MRRAYACLKNDFLMTFKWLRKQLSSNIDEAYLDMPNKLFFDCKIGSKKGYMEMPENFYLEILILVRSASISHY